MDDIVCARCGASWEIDYSAEEAPETFERQGGCVNGCSECIKVKPKRERKERAHVASTAEPADSAGEDSGG